MSTSAMSSGLPQRPSGNRAAIRAWTSPLAYPVSTGPGLMQLATIRDTESAWSIDRVIWCSAPLLTA
jgi:small neutral amino acid transporter SnatA (MarC family)